MGVPLMTVAWASRPTATGAGTGGTHGRDAHAAKEHK
jgi:hypothetical protein